MMSPNDLISVIVPIYNLGDRLRPCLDSLAAQSYRNLEILLVDDGSTDTSGSICDGFAAEDSRVRVIHKQNGGAWSSRNRGLAEAKGKYVVFPDGDDYFHKDYIRLLHEAIVRGGEECPLAICDFRKTDRYGEDTLSDSDPSFEDMDQKALLDKIVNYPSCGYAVWGSNWNKLYRKSAIREPFQKEYRQCEDYDSILRLFQYTDRAVYVRKVLYYWFQWPGQTTRSAEYDQVRNECRCRIFMDHLQHLPENLSAWRPGLLLNLYRRLIIWKESARGTSQFKTVSAAVRDYEKKTLGELVTCKQLTVPRRMRCLLSLHAPSLLRLFGTKIRMESA